MPLKKLALKSGVNRENTRYTNEGGWYDGDKIRFRQGTPEKIGGWQALTYTGYYQGVCRSLWAWTTIGSVPFLGMGTNLKYYIMYGAVYYDITPLRTTTTAGDVTFAATTGSATITVTDVAHGAIVNDFVTYSGAVSLGGNITAIVLNKEYQIVTTPTANTYTITAAVVATAGDAGNGGVATVGAYQINTGAPISTPLAGWGAGPWGTGTWGSGTPDNTTIRVWGAQNFGSDLVYGPQGEPMYYWAANLTVRGVAVSSLPGADLSVPEVQNLILVSDTSRFVIAMGVNDYGSSVQDPMLIRWSDQESVVTWTPAATNQAGSLRLSHGSRIVSYQQTRQEILIWTDTSLYSMQYIGPPIVWGSTLLADNITIASDRAAVSAAGVTYWMGVDKFYQYDGRVSTMRCDVRQYVFDDYNISQTVQTFASTVEKFNEIWWFYCSINSVEPDKYVVYNYAEDVWYYGSLNRTAWIDSSVISHFPIAAHPTYNNLMYQEYGNDDLSTGAAVPIISYITSAEFDLDDGNNVAFVWRMLPDITFRGSDSAAPRVTFYMLPLANSGSGYNNNTSVNSNQSVASLSYYPIARISEYPVEQFTGQLNTRVRGRQMSIKIESTELGVKWQLGSPRIDIRPDGRR